MLFDVAAILTSVAIGPVAEAFGVHEIAGYSITVSLPDVRDTGHGLLPKVPPVVSEAVASVTTAVAASSVSPASTPALTTTALGSTALIATALSTPVLTTPALTTTALGATSGVATAALVGDPLPAAIPDAPPLPFIGPEPASAPGEIVRGTRLLQQMSLLSASGISSFVTQHPDVVTALLASPPPTTDVQLWWNSMDLDHRNALRAASPQLVGNLDGIPFIARDLANRTLLRSTMADLENTIETAPGRTMVENAKSQLAMLQSISDALGVGSVESRRTLMTLDVTGQGRAAIVIGNLSEADYVTYMVPGMFFTIEGQMGYWADAAARLRDEQLSWLALTGHPESTVATVAWIGYHTPNLTNVGSMDNAYDAERVLAGAIQGLQTLREGNQPYVSVFAHSYGSTAALMALTDYDFQIDALAVVGSPGSPAQSVSQLHVRDGNVYVGEAQWDPVPNSAFFGSDPGAPSYGAKSFGVDGGRDSITGQPLLSSFGHLEYFAPGTESLRNLALIGIDQGQLVSSK